jgi:hypothetical protein
MNVPGWGPLAIDVSGLDLAGRRVGILADHDATLGGIVGQGEAEARDGKLIVAGSVSGTTDSAKRIIQLAKDGFEFQASVGVQSTEKKRIRSGDSVDVNDRTLTAPEGGFTLIEKGKLREVSIVALAADEETSVAIAASRRKGNEDMETELERVRAEERERMAYIESACNAPTGWGKNEDRVNDLKTRAIEGEISVEELQAKLLHIMRSSRPVPPSPINRGGVGHAEVIEASLLNRMGHGGLAEKTLGERACEQAKAVGAAHMLDLCRAALQAEGVDAPQGRMEMVKAALSTYSLPAALGNVANKLLLQTYDKSPATWRAFCQPRSVSDFKPNTAIRPSFTGQLEPVAPGGEGVLRGGEREGRGVARRRPGGGADRRAGGAVGPGVSDAWTSAVEGEAGGPAAAGGVRGEAGGDAGLPGVPEGGVRYRERSDRGVLQDPDEPPEGQRPAVGPSQRRGDHGAGVGPAQPPVGDLLEHPTPQGRVGPESSGTPGFAEADAFPCLRGHFGLSYK